MMCIRRGVLLSAVAVVSLLAACGPNGPTTPASVAALNKPPGIANLLKERLRTDLIKGTPPQGGIKLPARVRIVPYDYQTGLQQVDVLAQLDGLADALKKSPDIVTDASVLPEAYGESIGASFEGLLKLQAATRADAFLLVSGRATMVEARERSANVFEWFGRKSYWEAQANLEALWVEAPSGRFIPSIQAAGKAGPELVVGDDTSTSGSNYALRKQVETTAFRQLATAVLNQLRAERNAVPSPSPSPSPVLGANASPTPSTSPSASPSTSPSPSASPDTEATEATEATDL